MCSVTSARPLHTTVPLELFLVSLNWILCASLSPFRRFSYADVLLVTYITLRGKDGKLTFFN